MAISIGNRLNSDEGHQHLVIEIPGGHHNRDHSFLVGLAHRAPTLTRDELLSRLLEVEPGAIARINGDEIYPLHCELAVTPVTDFRQAAEGLAEGITRRGAVSIDRQRLVEIVEHLLAAGIDEEVVATAMGRLVTLASATDIADISTDEVARRLLTSPTKLW